MSKALNATGRPIAYSCSWPAYLGGLPPNVSLSVKTSLRDLRQNEPFRLYLFTVNDLQDVDRNAT